jgi:micrococcal nuclease
MRRQVLAASLIGASFGCVSLAFWALAGETKTPTRSGNSSRSSGVSHTTPRPTSSGSASKNTSGRSIPSGTSRAGGALHSVGGTQFKGGAHPAGTHTLSAEFTTHGSKVQHQLQFDHHWHHWHHPWIWGSAVYLPASNSGLVVSAPTGNTLSVLNGANIARPIRLAGVAAPLPGQPFFAESQQHLATLALNHHVRTFQVGVDRDGTVVAHVFLRDGVNLNERQLRDGMAFNLADDGYELSLGNAEQQAIASNTGLWVQPNPVAPWFAHGWWHHHR